MSALVPGDPASVSALGSDLVRRAGVLHGHHEDLLRVGGSLQGRTGRAAQALASSLTAQLRVVDATAEALAAGGRALQGFAVDLQHARALAAEAERFVQAHGLRLDPDGRVRPPFGAYPVEDSRGYEHHLDQGQQLVDRALAAREEAVRALRLRTEAHASALRQVPLQVARAVASSHDAPRRP